MALRRETSALRCSLSSCADARTPSRRRRALADSAAGRARSESPRAPRACIYHTTAPRRQSRASPTDSHGRGPGASRPGALCLIRPRRRGLVTQVRPEPVPGRRRVPPPYRAAAAGGITKESAPPANDATRAIKSGTRMTASSVLFFRRERRSMHVYPGRVGCTHLDSPPFLGVFVVLLVHGLRR